MDGSLGGDSLIEASDGSVFNNFGTFVVANGNFTSHPARAPHPCSTIEGSLIAPVNSSTWY